MKFTVFRVSSFQSFLKSSYSKFYRIKLCNYTEHWEELFLSRVNETLDIDFKGSKIGYSFAVLKFINAHVAVLSFNESHTLYIKPKLRSFGKSASASNPTQPWLSAGLCVAVTAQAASRERKTRRLDESAGYRTGRVFLGTYPRRQQESGSQLLPAPDRHLAEASTPDKSAFEALSVS